MTDPSSVLAIETATDQLGVALVEEGRVLASYELLAERPHAIELPQAVSRVLGASGKRFEEIDGFAIDIGPGSFTGLRIGLAFIKALVFRVRKPLIGVPSLDVLAANIACGSSRVCPLLDAKQRKVYAALYTPADGRLARILDYSLLTVQELVPQLGQDPVVLLGDGAGLYRDVLVQHLGQRAVFASPECSLPRAATLGRLGLDRLRQGQQDDPATLVPMYLYRTEHLVHTPARPAATTPPSPESR